MNSDKAAIDEILQDPAAHFPNPGAVLKDSRFSAAQKRKILESWEQDARRLEESAGEAMAGGEPSRLAEVERALIEMEEGGT